MAFWWKNSRVLWHGLGILREDMALPWLHAIHPAPCSLMDQLLAHFDDLFAEPSRLSPPRSRDHRITLVLRTAPVSVRPYLYPTFRRTSWSGNAPPCSPKASSAYQAQCSPRRCCWCGSRTTRGGFASTTGP